MGDLFQDKGIKPMQIGAEGQAFDFNDYLYELRLDGECCVAYLDANGAESIYHYLYTQSVYSTPDRISKISICRLITLRYAPCCKPDLCAMAKS